MNTGTVPTDEIRKALEQFEASTAADEILANVRVIHVHSVLWLRSLLEENERLREALIKERDDAMIWDGITVVDRINKVLIQYATINESKESP